MDLLQVISVIVLAILPAFVWSYIFLGKSDECRSTLLKVFFWGGLATLPLLLYRMSWQFFPSLNFIANIKEQTSETTIMLGDGINFPIAHLLIFMTIGMIEEILKAFVINKSVPKKQINSIADAVEYSIAGSLGFAFVENIFYLGEVYTIIGSSAIIAMFVSRAVFATFAHVLFSAIFGYYHGIGLFAKENIKDLETVGDTASLEQRMGFRVPYLWKVRIFRIEELLVGLCYAGALHAFYNIFLEMGYNLFLIPFLVFGTMFVSRLLKRESVRAVANFGN
ncbi:PrsW family intramembrane metalloprotease [Candidatus Gracilibacteria bacterium]|jgi:RsiW-degrading membrane proteinase PrsW (M82 family)|nr:PrsW family intramembrane metalloprotease [Candidatus Gracilibacteria bacterium]